MWAWSVLRSAERHVTVIRRITIYQGSMVLTRKAGRGPKTLLYVLVVVISSLKTPKAFLIRSTAQRNFAHAFVLIFPTDLPSQILKFSSN